MGEPAATARSRLSAGPAPAATAYAPDPAERARLAFADGPSPSDRAPSGPRAGAGGPRPSRLALAAAAAAVAVVVVAAIAAFGWAGRSDTAPVGDVAAVVDRGPFDSPDAFVGALPLPASFARLAPDDVSAFATADVEYVVDGDFDAACANLGRALRALDPAYPDLVPKEYEGGGVNRCEAEAPMAALHGATVRALVLEVNNGAQLYIEDPIPAPEVGPGSARAGRRGSLSHPRATMVDEGFTTGTHYRVRVLRITWSVGHDRSSPSRVRALPPARGPRWPHPRGCHHECASTPGPKGGDVRHAGIRTDGHLRRRDR